MSTQKILKKLIKPFTEWSYREISSRFFNGDLRLCKEIKLIKEELDLFEMFEWEIL
jgi:hypothetical protein